MNSCRCSKPRLPFLQTTGGWRAAAMLTSVTVLTACSASPSRNILGSYFPTWMICALLGLLGVVILRVVLGKAGIDAALPMPVVVYLCLWITITLAIWLLWLG